MIAPFVLKIDSDVIPPIPPAVRKQLKDGKSLRIFCKHAIAVRDACQRQGIRLHATVRPEVGTDFKGRRFISIKTEDGTMFHWYEDVVDSRVWADAKKHDSGKETAAFTYELDSSKAIVTRPRVRTDARTRHDLDSDNQPRMRPNGSTGGVREMKYKREW